MGSSDPGTRQAINDAVENYESACERDGQADLEAFLPTPDHPFYLAVLCELVRVDLEYGYERNQAKPLEDYERRFPELFRDPQKVQEIAFEEFRLRKNAGKSPSAAEYRDRYGLHNFDRCATDHATNEAPALSQSELTRAAAAYRAYRRDGKHDLAWWLASSGISREGAEVFEAIYGEIQKDLHRQPDNLPLKQTRETSLPGRLKRWATRRPRRTATATIVAAALAIAAGLAIGMISRHHRHERLKAYDSLNRLTAQVSEVEFLLGVPDAPSQMSDEGIALCRQVVDSYGARTDSRWLARPLASALSEQDRVPLRRGMEALLCLWARALTWRAEGSTDRRAEQIAEAERLIAAAEASYGSASVSRDLRLQSAALARLTGRDAEAEHLLAEAGEIPIGTTRERLFLISSYLYRGMDREALALSEQASQLDPLDGTVWLIRGHCLARLAQNERADQSFSLGIALHPGFTWAYLDRGRVALERRDFDRALADFDRVFEARPDQPEALLNRALAKLGRGDASGATADINLLMGRTDAPSRALFIRAQAHKAREDLVAAQADRSEGLARSPGDELSWIARGLNRLPADPAGALKDFRAARRLNPKSLQASLNEASVLSETLGRTEEAVKALSQALADHPQSIPILAARSVLLARLGRRREALQDIAASLSRDDSAETLYKAACTFALTSRLMPSDGGEALRLLALAVRKDGTRLGQIDTDPNLAVLRDRPEFRRLREALQIVCPPNDSSKTNVRITA